MRGESARPGKRPLRALSASEKMEAIQRVHEGESKASVARDIGVPESTLRGWCKSEHKIRGMARNSSTPDSEAHSPASSSGTNLGAAAMAAGGGANHSSEDESPGAKRAKIDQGTNGPCAASSYGINENSENDARLDVSSKIDYMSLMTSMASMRPENRSLLLQQLGLLSGASGGTLTKSLLNLQTAGLPPHSSTVGLVENGLQYTKGSSSAKAGRHSISAIAPTQIDSVTKSCARKSLPAAAEAPATPVPASPRKTNENIGIHRESKSSKKDPGLNKKPDESLWLWLTQQQQLMGQQSASFNPSTNQQDGSWFWQYYKQCGFNLAAPAAVSSTPVAKKSPSKTRALLDNVLCNNNNNENVKRSLNMDETDVESQEDVPVTSEEAIEHGEKFFKWLDRCSDPAVTRLQIMQFKYLLDNLKSCRKKPSSLGMKQSRK